MNTDQPLALRGFAGAIEVTAEAEARKVELIAAAKEVLTVTDDSSQLVAIEAERGLKSLRTQVEAARKAIKAPVLELGKKIDAAAEKFIADAEREERRLEGMVNHYQQILHRQRQEAEAAAERERQRIASEAAAAQRAIEEAERQRIAAEHAKAQAELLKGKAKEKADAEAQRLAAAAKLAEEHAFEKSLNLETEVAPIVPVAELPKGVTVKPTFDYRVIGANEYKQRESLILLAQKFPHLVNIEPRRADILDTINRAGVTELPGLEIHEILKTTIR